MIKIYKTLEFVLLPVCNWPGLLQLNDASSFQVDEMCRTLYGEDPGV